MCEMKASSCRHFRQCFTWHSIVFCTSHTACLCSPAPVHSASDCCAYLRSALSRFVQDESGKLETLVPVLSLADFPDASAAALHVKAVMLAYPRTSAIIIREAGILCWGLMAHAQVRALFDMHASLQCEQPHALLSKCKPQFVSTL